MLDPGPVVVDLATETIQLLRAPSTTSSILPRQAKPLANLFRNCLPLSQLQAEITALRAQDEVNKRAQRLLLIQQEKLEHENLILRGVIAGTRVVSPVIEGALTTETAGMIGVIATAEDTTSRSPATKDLKSSPMSLEEAAEIIQAAVSRRHP